MAAVEMDFISGGAKSADKISYDNTSSGLDASTVQGAIDTVNSNLNHNTTTERKVGLWEVGGVSKPIYEITVTGTIPTITDGEPSTQPVSIPTNIDTIVYVMAYFQNTSNRKISFLPYFNNSISRFRKMSIDITNSKIEFQTNESQASGCLAVATIRYTKTTD